MILKDLVSASMFQKSFFRKLPHTFYWQKTPLQVYPLSFVGEHLITPLPFFQSTVNYIIHIKEGSICQFIGKDYYDIKAPALLVVLNETIQSLHSISTDVKGHIVLIEDLTMSAIFQNEDIFNLFVIEPVLKLSTTESNWIHTVNKLLYTEVPKVSPNRRIAEGLLQGLLYNIMELSESKRSLSRNQLIAIKFKLLVRKNFRNQKNIAFYTGKLHISENYLNRCVKKVFHKTSKEVITEKLKKA